MVVLKKRLKIFIGILLILFWSYIVINITLIGRGQSFSYNLQLFWCIKEAWTTKNAADWYFIVGNILMFIPFGMILPSCFDAMRSWVKVSGIGFVISASIELIQLIFHRGFFEFDDMFNNTLGAIMGYGLFVLFFGVFTKNQIGTNKERIMLLIVWLVVVAFLTVAQLMGQPVFTQILGEIRSFFSF